MQEAVAEVVRIGIDRESKHLDKILDRLASAQKIKAGYIVRKKCVAAISGRIEEIKREHTFYKEAYSNGDS